MRYKIALALGGGGVRGLAHIGVLRILQGQVPIHLIVGTSMGAIIGGMFCIYEDINALEEKVKELLLREEIKSLQSFLGRSATEEKTIILQRFLLLIKNIYLWNLRGIKKWLVDKDKIVPLLEEVFEDRNFSSCRIPFACVATDLNTGERVIIKEGKLLDAVLASSAIPGIFPPLKVGKRLLVDGGTVELVPVKSAKELGADFIIGVNVEGFRLKTEFHSGVDIIFQTDQIQRHHLNILTLSNADFIISPKVEDKSWADFAKAQDCIQEGIKITERLLPQLKKKISHTALKMVFRRFFKLGR